MQKCIMTAATIWGFLHLATPSFSDQMKVYTDRNGTVVIQNTRSSTPPPNTMRSIDSYVLASKSQKDPNRLSGRDDLSYRVVSPPDYLTGQSKQAEPLVDILKNRPNPEYPSALEQHIFSQNSAPLTFEAKYNGAVRQLTYDQDCPKVASFESAAVVGVEKEADPGKVQAQLGRQRVIRDVLSALCDPSRADLSRYDTFSLTIGSAHLLENRGNQFIYEIPYTFILGSRKEAK